MRITTAGIFSSLLCLSATQFGVAAHAADTAAVKKTSKVAKSCDQATSQADMTRCAGEAYKTSDAALNRVYKEVRANIKDDKAATQKLVEAQRAWIAFRDAECSYQGAATEGGSAHGMIVSMCLDEQTRARTDALSKSLECEEGDLSCIAPKR